MAKDNKSWTDTFVEKIKGKGSSQDQTQKILDELNKEHKTPPAPPKNVRIK